VAIEAATRFVAGANRKAVGARFAVFAEGILYGGVLLALDLQEIADAEIFGGEPLEEDRAVFPVAHQVNVVGGGDPPLLPLGSDRLERELDGLLSVGVKRKGLYRRVKKVP
jgi:hypothetical protein